MTHLSAEGVFEVEVKNGAGNLAAKNILQVELVSLQDVVHILGLPVNNGPERVINHFFNPINNSQQHYYSNVAKYVWLQVQDNAYCRFVADAGNDC